MYYNTLFVGMDVHKETFSLCCYDLQQDRIFHAQKMEADYNQVLNYLNAVRKAIGDDVQFVCGYEAGCLGFAQFLLLFDFLLSAIFLSSFFIPCRISASVLLSAKGAFFSAFAFGGYSFTAAASFFGAEAAGPTHLFTRSRPDFWGEYPSFPILVPFKIEIVFSPGAASQGSPCKDTHRTSWSDGQCVSKILRKIGQTASFPHPNHAGC